jgi:hypothetical protein
MARSYKARKQNKNSSKTRKNSKRGSKTRKKNKGGDFRSGLKSYGSAAMGTFKSAGGKNMQFLAILNAFNQQEFRTFKYNMINMAGASPDDRRFASFNPTPITTDDKLYQ